MILELKPAEIDSVAGGLDFEGRPISQNVEDGNSLDHYIRVHGVVIGTALWVADEAIRAAG